MKILLAILSLLTLTLALSTRAYANSSCIGSDCVTTSQFYHVSCAYDSAFNCIGPDPAHPSADWGQAGTMVDVTWYLPSSCAIINTRGWQKIAGNWTKVEVAIENNPTNSAFAPLPYCAILGSGQDINIHSSWANAGNPYWSVPDACLATPSNCYATTRVRIYSYITGLVYEFYISNDGLHSTPICWQTGCN